MNKQKYCLGFVFTEDGAKVLLILKQKPEWQRFRYNGIGGKTEPEENEFAAMRREFQEETGFDVVEKDWSKFASFSGYHFEIACFSAFNSAAFNTHGGACTQDYKANEPIERVASFAVEKLPDNIIPNVRWLIPMALSMTRGEPCKEFAVIETRNNH